MQGGNNFVLHSLRLVSAFIFGLFYISASAQLAGVNGIGVGAGAANSVQAFARYQSFADNFYANENYTEAIRHYERLAEYGDKFAMYRLATIYEEGLGTDDDLVEAFAWSYVASESKREVFKEYHRQIRAALEPQQLEVGIELANKRLSEYGNYTVARRARAEIRKAQRECTGSRVGATCDRVSVRGARCNGFNNSIPSNKCLMLGGVGLSGNPPISNCV